MKIFQSTSLNSFIELLNLLNIKNKIKKYSKNFQREDIWIIFLAINYETLKLIFFNKFKNLENLELIGLIVEYLPLQIIYLYERKKKINRNIIFIKLLKIIIGYLLGKMIYTTLITIYFLSFK